MNDLSMHERLARVGFADRKDARTYHDYRHTIFHAETYDIVGRMDYQECLVFVRERELHLSRITNCTSPHLCFEFGYNVGCSPCEKVSARNDTHDRGNLVGLGC